MTTHTRSVVLASNNQGKLGEFQQLFSELNISMLPQSEFNVGSVEETGVTFIENALIKARHAAKISGMPTIADDSGLEVDALQGRPGVYSARFAGEHASDSDNNRKLLEYMSDIPEEQRQARFHCLLVYLRHADDPTPGICHGVWEGSVLKAPAGEEGFGYDLLFFVPSEQCSAAELTKARKSEISHRGQAMQALLEKLRFV